MYLSSSEFVFILFRLTWTQDGAPCHAAGKNMRYLDSLFADRLVSRKSIRGRDWPARSPDLNPCDFFLWGYLKSKVYTPKPANLDQLEQNIINEINAIPPAMIRRALLDVRKRALKVIANNGGYCEG